MTEPARDTNSSTHSEKPIPSTEPLNNSLPEATQPSLVFQLWKESKRSSEASNGILNETVRLHDSSCSVDLSIEVVPERQTAFVQEIKIARERIGSFILSGLPLPLSETLVHCLRQTHDAPIDLRTKLYAFLAYEALGALTAGVISIRYQAAEETKSSTEGIITGIRIDRQTSGLNPSLEEFLSGESFTVFQTRRFNSNPTENGTLICYSWHSPDKGDRATFIVTSPARNRSFFLAGKDIAPTIFEIQAAFEEHGYRGIDEHPALRNSKVPEFVGDPGQSEILHYLRTGLTRTGYTASPIQPYAHQAGQSGDLDSFRKKSADHYNKLVNEQLDGQEVINFKVAEHSIQSRGIRFVMMKNAEFITILVQRNKSQTIWFNLPYPDRNDLKGYDRSELDWRNRLNEKANALFMQLSQSTDLGREQALKQILRLAGEGNIHYRNHAGASVSGEVNVIISRAENIAREYEDSKVSCHPLAHSILRGFRNFISGRDTLKITRDRNNQFANHDQFNDLIISLDPEGAGIIEFRNDRNTSITIPMEKNKTGAGGEMFFGIERIVRSFMDEPTSAIQELTNKEFTELIETSYLELKKDRKINAEMTIASIEGGGYHAILKDHRDRAHRLEVRVDDKGKLRTMEFTQEDRLDFVQRTIEKVGAWWRCEKMPTALRSRFKTDLPDAGADDFSLSDALKVFSYFRPGKGAPPFDPALAQTEWCDQVRAYMRKFGKIYEVEVRDFEKRVYH